MLILLRRHALVFIYFSTKAAAAAGPFCCSHLTILVPQCKQKQGEKYETFPSEPGLRKKALISLCCVAVWYLQHVFNE